MASDAPSGDLLGDSPPATNPVLSSPEPVSPIAAVPPAMASSAMTLPATPLLTDATASSSAATVPSIHSLHNIGNLIPFKLDVQSGSYSKWRELWRCVLTMYAVQHHVASYSAPDQQTPAWRHTDLTLLLLLYTTITNALYEVIRGDANTAFLAWNKLQEFFLAHQPAQAVHLSAEFRSLSQGNLRMAEYCARLKALADALANVDEPVKDRTLTLQLLRGLSRRYQVIATVLPMQTPFPSFNEARSRLLLKEIQQDARDRSDGSTALSIGIGGGPSTGSGSSSSAPHSSSHRGKQPTDPAPRGGGTNRGRGGGHTGGRGQPHLAPGGHTPWMGYFAPWGAPLPPQGRAPWVPPNAAGVLGPRPGNPAHAYPVIYPGAPTPANAPPPSSWDQAGLIAAMQNMTMQQPHQPDEWYLDSGASSHVTGNPGNLDSFCSPPKHSSRSIIVGDGSHLPVVATGSAKLTSRPFYLRNILYSPHVVTNLISVRRFCIDNSVTIEFYPFGFVVKDLATRTPLMSSSSYGQLYSFSGGNTTNTAVFSVGVGTLWHRRLGHPSAASLSRLAKDFLPTCNKQLHPRGACDACQLGRQARLPFPESTSFTTSPFQLIHCDLWTSPTASFSGYKYYLLVLDDFTHFSWSFPLRNKSDAAATLERFYTYALTQFHVALRCVQCDNGGEFLNVRLHTFLYDRGVTLLLSCPHTSPRNGKAERAIRSTNDILRTLLLQAHMPPPFWVESLHSATYLLNIRPSRAIYAQIPYYLLYGTSPNYSSLRAFGCLCYPNLYATMPHKLAPGSVRCVLLGMPLEHKGYRCLDLQTRRVITSRHVVFDEDQFPYAASPIGHTTARELTPPATDNPQCFHLGPPAPPPAHLTPASQIGRAHV